MLHVTAKWGVEEVAKWLLNHGADYTIKNRVKNVYTNIWFLAVSLD